MPWGGDLPEVHNDMGEEILKADDGTLLSDSDSEAETQLITSRLWPPISKSQDNHMNHLMA